MSNYFSAKKNDFLSGFSIQREDFFPDLLEQISWTADVSLFAEYRRDKVFPPSLEQA